MKQRNSMLDNRRNELMLVGLLVWFVLSVGIFIFLLLPFVVPQHQLAQFIPECDWQSQFHKPCAFCGDEYRILRHLARRFCPGTSFESVKPLHLLYFFLKYVLRSDYLKTKHTSC